MDVTSLLLTNNLDEGCPIFLAFSSYPIYACTNIDRCANVLLKAAQIYIDLSLGKLLNKIATKLPADLAGRVSGS